MFHELVKGGEDQYEVATGQKVKVVKIVVRGTFEIILPDFKNEKGEIIGHGGSIGLRSGDYLLGREDGSLVGVPALDYKRMISVAPLAIPAVTPKE